ncbi:MAG: helix-turn-helix domain-containing protein [Arenicella sp.]
MSETVAIALSKAEQDQIRIGLQIRDLRKSKGITLTEMADKIGKSVGYISQIERGVSTLPIPVLQMISEALDVKLTWFFHGDNAPDTHETGYIVRKNARRHLDFFGTGISEELLSPWMNGEHVLILTTFSPLAQSDAQPRKRKGTESGYVKSGIIELTIGTKKFTLNSGDSFSITGDEPHFVSNPSKDQDAVVVWVLAAGVY